MSDTATLEPVVAEPVEVLAPKAAQDEQVIDMADVDAMVLRVGRDAEHLIPLLQAIQHEYNWLPPAALERLCTVTDITPDAVTGVSTFYSQFRHYPVGKHVIKTCIGTACHVKGASTLDENFRSHLNIKGDGHTDSDGTFTVEKVACLGCCMLAPVVQVDEVIYGHVEARNLPDLLRDFLATDGSADEQDETGDARKDAIGDARICLCSSCVAGGSKDVHDELSKHIKAMGLPVGIKKVGCTGFSFQTPLVEFALYNGKKYRYGKVQPNDVRKLLLKHFEPASWIRRTSAKLFHLLENLLTDEAWDPPTRFSKDVRSGNEARYAGPQTRLATEHAGVLDPICIEDYLRHDGFKAMKKCLEEMTPAQVIDEMLDSGLRGRGGAGFPTGRKWAFTQGAAGDLKYIIANGDEGDPGAFMDRMILESFPYRVIEGMVIAAYAAGASKGFLYIRAEYPLATERILASIEACMERGYLGKNIMGTDFSLELVVTEGAGAFVCGEETALMSAIEGGRGMPRYRPPFPAVSGLWNKPTLINNVETLALVPWIYRNGAAAFSAMGNEKCKGSKTFALAGKVVRGGMIEVPMGMTIRQIVEDIGGGIPDGRKLKAVLMGGPSGGCVPEHLADTPVDYEALRAVGAIMGSGGMVVLDDTDCMVDIARYFKNNR